MKCAVGVGGDGDRISYIVWCLTPDDKNARRLTALVKGLARKHNAAIIGGDLNAAMESDAMKSIVADGLADAQATAAVSPKSFHADHYDPRRDAKGAYHGVPAVRGMADKAWSLDHVFYDPATGSVSRFDPGHHAGGLRALRPSSDRRGLRSAETRTGSLGVHPPCEPA